MTHTITIPIDGEVITYDFDAYTATANNVARPVTDQERAMIDATKRAQVEERQRFAERETDERAAAERLAALAAPIVPLPVEGTTVEEVKASAEASLADLAQQMTDRINLIAGN